MKHWCLALLMGCLAVPLAAQDTPTPQIAHPVIEASDNAIMPDTVASLVPLKVWGDGTLREVSWTDDGHLRVVTTLEERVYDIDALEAPLSVQKAWPEGVKNADGRLLLIDIPGYGPHAITLKDAETGDDIAHFEGYNTFFDPTGQFLALTMDLDGKSGIQVYDVSQTAQPALIQSLQGKALLFKGHWLIAQDENSLMAADLETSRIIPFQLLNTDNVSDISLVDQWLSPDQTTLAAVYRLHKADNSYVETLAFYDIAALSSTSDSVPPIYTNDLLGSLEGPTPIAGTWRADSQLFLVSQSWKQTAFEAIGDTFKEAWVLYEIGVENMAQMLFSPDGASLVTIPSAYYEPSLVYNRKRITYIPEGVPTFSPDSRWLAIARPDSSVVILDARTGETLNTLSLKTFAQFVVTLDQTQIQSLGRAYDLATGSLLEGVRTSTSFNLSADQTLAILTYGETFPAQYYINDIQADKGISMIQGAFSAGESPRFSPDNRLFAVFGLAVANQKEHLFLYDPQTGGLQDAVEIGYAGSQTIVGDAAFSGNSQAIAWTRWGIDPNQLGFYNIHTGEKTVFDIDDVRVDVESLALNYDGSVAFTIGRDGLAAWNTATGERLNVSALAATQDIQWIAMSSDGSRLYTVDKLGQFTVWGLPE